MNAPAHPVEPELTIYHVASLRQQWLAAWNSGTRSFDLAQVAEIDGAGAQLLASLWRMARRDGEPLALDNPGANVREALALIGAAAVLDTTPEGAAHA